MIFAQNLNAERAKLHLSADTLAKNCGVSRSYITLIENGKRLPSVKLIPKIAHALELQDHTVLNWYLEDMRIKLQKAIKP